MKLIGLGVSFARVPFAGLALATLEAIFVELQVLEAFAEPTVVRVAVVVGLVRGFLTGSSLGLGAQQAALSESPCYRGCRMLSRFPLRALHLWFSSRSTAPRRHRCLASIESDLIARGSFIVLDVLVELEASVAQQVAGVLRQHTSNTDVVPNFVGPPWHST